MDVGEVDGRSRVSLVSPESLKEGVADAMGIGDGVRVVRAEDVADTNVDDVNDETEDERDACMAGAEESGSGEEVVGVEVDEDGIVEDVVGGGGGGEIDVVD